MAVKFTDSEIAKLIEERKVLSEKHHSGLEPRIKRAHKEQDLNIEGEDGSHFRLILRQSTVNRFDFSIILAVMPEGSNQLFRLRRYNGKSHEHTNQIEGMTPFYDFHIHYATERYQDCGAREDAYAETTDRYADFPGALLCMLKDCAFIVPEGGQTRLFGGFNYVYRTDSK
ncbi:MAG: hypothetical protein ACLFUS_07130 [Candidatus Sumerlaeia bacterium]